MYSVEERQIFKFWDGEKDRMVDPLAIYRKLGSLNSDLQADIAKGETGDIEAMSRVLKVTREAFGVKEFAEVDGQLHGLLDNEVFRLIMDFGEFCHSVKKNTLNAPTSSPPTDTSDDQSTTNVS